MIKIKPKQELNGVYKFKGKDGKRIVHKPTCSKVKYNDKIIACPAISMD